MTWSDLGVERSLWKYKMGWRRMGLEARRPAGGGVVGALVRKGRGSRNGVNATYLKDTKRVKKAGLND